LGVGWWRGTVETDGDAGLADVFETECDFVFSAYEVEGDGVADELLFETFEVEVLAVAEEFGAMVFISDA
jgi:hypothetical protein